MILYRNVFIWIVLIDFYGWIIYFFGLINDGWLSFRNKLVVVIYLYIYWNRWVYFFCYVLILNLLEIFFRCSCSRLMWWIISFRTVGIAFFFFRRWFGWVWLLFWFSFLFYCSDFLCSFSLLFRIDLTILREKLLSLMLMNSCECWVKFSSIISI